MYVAPIPLFNIRMFMLMQYALGNFFNLCWGIKYIISINIIYFTLFFQIKWIKYVKCSMNLTFYLKFTRNSEMAYVIYWWFQLFKKYVSSLLHTHIFNELVYSVMFKYLVNRGMTQTFLVTCMLKSLNIWCKWYFFFKSYVLTISLFILKVKYI